MKANIDFGDLTFGANNSRRDAVYVRRVSALNALKKILPNGLNVICFDARDVVGNLYDMQNSGQFPGLMPDGLQVHALIDILDSCADNAKTPLLNLALSGDLSKAVFWCFNRGGDCVSGDLLPAGLPTAVVAGFTTYCYMPTQAPYVLKSLLADNSYIQHSVYAEYLKENKVGKHLTAGGSRATFFTKHLHFHQST